ncbi:MAG: hypothetical protein HOP29_02715 [Phycisphaerales bacterium]|nr:hypothetical protein [Phycisphaerales bacterium]
MKKKAAKRRVRKPAEEFDFRGGVRGKYAERYKQGTNVILLEPDVARWFPDSASVNEALRACALILQSRSQKRVNGKSRNS